MNGGIDWFFTTRSLVVGVARTEYMGDEFIYYVCCSLHGVLESF